MHNYQEGCKMLFLYRDKCSLLSGWIHTCFTLCMLGTFLVYAFLLSVFFNHLFKKSSTEEHPHIVKQFGSRSVQQNVGPDLDQCFLQS